MTEDIQESNHLPDGKSAGEYTRTTKTGLSWLEMICITILFLFLYLPFINKAFHIDDYCFIKLSGMTDWNPLQAFPINYDYSGGILPNVLPYDTTHPFLVPYFIKIVIALFGENETTLHLAFMIFPLIALFSLMKLNTVFFPDSRRIALILGVFFCTLPAFLVNAQNIMTDVPTLAFLLLAMAGFFDGLENGTRGMTWLGSAALTMAIFTSYQMVVFVPLLFLYALWKRKLNLPVAVAIISPVLVLLAWLLAVYAKYDYFPVIKSKLSGKEGNVADVIRAGHSRTALIKKIFDFFAFLGAAMIWVTPLHYVLKKRTGTFLVLFLTLLLACLPAAYALTGYPFMPNVFLSALVALGLLTIATLVSKVRQRRKESGKEYELFLLFWLFSVIGYYIALLPWCSARYLLPAFPPALMLLLNDPAWSFSTRARRIGLSCVFCGAVLFAFASAYSDYRLADSYRDFAAKTKVLRANGGNAFNVWYIGDWGMHYYMDRAGARYLHADSTEPMRGDYVVIPEMPRLWYPSLQVQKRLSLFYNMSYRSRLPLRLFNGRSHAGFYSHGWGMLPFAFSSEPDEVFLVFEVVR